MTKMRAKMKITDITTNEDGDQEDLNLSAVCKGQYDETGTDENNTFARFTPAAELQMSIMNPALHGKFNVGDTYYLDFTVADGKPHAE